MARRRKAKKETVAQKVTRIATSPPPRKQTKGEIIATLVIFSILCVIVISVIAKINSAITDFKNRPVRTTEVATTQEITVPERTVPKTTAPPQTEPATPAPETVPEVQTLHFIVNTDSHCIHIDEHCMAAEAIAPENRKEIDIPEDELSRYSGVYWGCGKCCSASIRTVLPKFE